MTISDPFVLTTLAFGLPFLGYFGGIVIRKTALDRAGSLTLGRQLLVGIPLSLVTVPPLLNAFPAVLTGPMDAGAVPRYLISLGVVMGAGMALPEAATRFLQNCIRRAGTSVDSEPPQRRSPVKARDGRAPRRVA